MKDDQTKSAILQWLVPTIVLVIVVIAMLFNFSAKSSQAAEAEVEKSMINVAERYAVKVNYALSGVTNAARPIGSLVNEHKLMENDTVTIMTEALCSNTEAYEVIYCSKDGRGIRQNGNRINVKQLSYFSEIFSEQPEKEETTKSKSALVEAKTEKYIYTEDDGLDTAKKAVVVIFSLNEDPNGDKLLIYYALENLKSIFKKTEFDSDAFYAIVTPDGLIMESAGSQSKFLQSDNMWELVKQNTESDEDVVKAMVRMKNKTNGSFSAVVEGEERKIVYAPIGINNWALAIGINQQYVDYMHNKEWGSTKSMIYQLVISIWVFLGLVALLNVINKIKSSEKSKALEEKADTDLLTSLNNKLATERKIKAYMEAYPEDQGMLFVLDIDNFKKINDTLGHAFGDEVLRSLGHQIGAVFRATDVIGRTGGDEFTIFLKHLNEDALFEKEAKKLCNFFRSFQAGEYVKYAATASIGVAVFPKDGKDFESLYKAADSALYIAKKRGKNQLAFYGDEDKKSEGKKRVEEESRMKK